MKRIILLLLLAVSYFGQAQTDLNAYKYVLIEKQFHFQNEPGEYDLNELTRFLFRKYGFTPILTSEIYPDDLKSDYCLALTSEVRAKGALRTKVTITLKNCRNEVVFETTGSTKEKDFRKMYSIGIRKAFEPYADLNYSYVSKAPSAQVSEKKVEESRPATPVAEPKETAAVVSEPKATLKTPETTKASASVSVAIKGLESIPTKNGFIIKDQNNRIVYTMVATKVPGVYLLAESRSIVYKNNQGQWVKESIEGNATNTEILDIKF